MSTDRFARAGGGGGERFTHAGEGGDPGELVARFQEALIEENMDEFGVCIQQLQDAFNAGKPAGPALRALVRQLSVMVHFHEDLMREMLEDPEVERIWNEFAAWMDSILEIDDGEDDDRGWE